MIASGGGTIKIACRWFKRFLSEVREGVIPQTLWKFEDVGHTQEAKKELLEHVEYENTDNVLDTLKAHATPEAHTSNRHDPKADNLVLDFFAGSCSTAHAVLALNRRRRGE